MINENLFSLIIKILILSSFKLLVVSMRKLGNANLAKIYQGNQTLLIMF